MPEIRGSHEGQNFVAKSPDKSKNPVEEARQRMQILKDKAKEAQERLDGLEAKAVEEDINIPAERDAAEAQLHVDIENAGKGIKPASSEKPKTAIDEARLEMQTLKDMVAEAEADLEEVESAELSKVDYVAESNAKEAKLHAAIQNAADLAKARKQISKS